MHNAKIKNMNDVQELNAYLKENPNDQSVLVLAAFFEEQSRFKKEHARIEKQNERLKQEIEGIIEQLNNRPRGLKKLWRGIKGSEKNEKLAARLDELEQQQKDLYEEYAYLLLTSPVDWRYELALDGNQLFTIRQ